MYHTYILQSETTGRFYIGQTNDLEDRMYRHNAGHSKATKGRGPWKLIYSQSFESRAEAVALESKLKKFKNSSYLLQWIFEQSNAVAQSGSTSR